MSKTTKFLGIKHCRHGYENLWWGIDIIIVSKVANEELFKHPMSSISNKAGMKLFELGRNS